MAEKEIIQVSFVADDWPRFEELRRYAQQHELTWRQAIIELVNAGLSHQA